MTLSRRERTLAEMLERWHDLHVPERSDVRYSGHGAILAARHADDCAWIEAGEPCTCWLAAYHELDCCLTVMRKLGRQKAVAYQDSKGTERTMPLATAYQQLVWWYRDVTYRSVTVYDTKVEKRMVRGQSRWLKVQVERKHGGRRREPVRHPDAREEKAQAALRFLGELYRGTPQLPRDIAKLEQAA